MDIWIHEVSSSGDHEYLHKFHDNLPDNCWDPPVWAKKKDTAIWIGV